MAENSHYSNGSCPLCRKIKRGVSKTNGMTCPLSNFNFILNTPFKKVIILKRHKDNLSQSESMELDNYIHYIEISHYGEVDLFNATLEEGHGHYVARITIKGKTNNG